MEIQPGCVADQFGFREKGLGHMIDVYQNDLCIQGNPREFNRDKVLDLLKWVMHEPY